MQSFGHNLTQSIDTYHYFLWKWFLNLNKIWLKCVKTWQNSLVDVFSCLELDITVDSFYLLIFFPSHHHHPSYFVILWLIPPSPRKSLTFYEDSFTQLRPPCLFCEFLSPLLTIISISLFCLSLAYYVHMQHVQIIPFPAVIKYFYILFFVILSVTFSVWLLSYFVLDLGLAATGLDILPPFSNISC